MGLCRGGSCAECADRYRRCLKQASIRRRTRTGVVEGDGEDGEVVHESDPPIFATKLNEGCEGWGVGWEGVGWVPDIGGLGWPVSGRTVGPPSR